MNCFLTCPKNLLNNEKDDNKELKFLEIFDDSKNDIGNKRNIKKHLFHYLIMPFLDFHYQIIFHKIVSPYKNNRQTSPKTNNHINIIKKQSPPKVNINTRYNTIQNSNDKNTKISPNKIYNTIQNSNDKKTNISPPKSNTNSN